MWEKGERFAVPYAMVMAPPLDIVPDTNIYYDSGNKKVPDGMRVTICSDVGSLVYELWVILTVAIPLIPASIVALFGKKELKKD